MCVEIEFIVNLGFLHIYDKLSAELAKLLEIFSHMPEKKFSM